MQAVLDRDPVKAKDSELNSIGEVNHALNSFAASAAKQNEQASGRARVKAKLVGPKGEVIELPDVVFNLLRQIVSYLAQGKAIRIIPVGMELTTQAAANLLNISRPHLVKLVDDGKIPFKRVGTHRRIRFADLMAYKARQDAEQRRLLAEMAQFSQDLGLYEDFDYEEED